jgi:hypothetical protein
MIVQACQICQTKYTTKYRGWYDRYVPWTCSSACFRRFLLETEDDISGIIDADPRITKFITPERFEMRSGYEREFRRWLIRREVPHQYEPFSFTLESRKRYVPDFLADSRIFVEVKGLWNSESKKKFLSMTREFYDLPIVVVDRDFLDMLKRTEKARA